MLRHALREGIKPRTLSPQRPHLPRDAQWFGTTGAPDLSATSHTLAWHLSGAACGEDDPYVMVNAYSSPLEFTVQVPGTWRLLLDTSAHQPPQLAATGPASPKGRWRYRRARPDGHYVADDAKAAAPDGVCRGARFTRRVEQTAAGQERERLRRTCCTSPLSAAVRDNCQLSATHCRAAGSSSRMCDMRGVVRWPWA